MMCDSRKVYESSLVPLHIWAEINVQVLSQVVRILQKAPNDVRRSQGPDTLLKQEGNHSLRAQNWFTIPFCYVLFCIQAMLKGLKM